MLSILSSIIVRSFKYICYPIPFFVPYPPPYPYPPSIFGLNMHNRLIDNMASDGVEQLTQAIRCNAAIGGRLTTLNVTRNVMNLACSQGKCRCCYIQHSTH